MVLAPLPITFAAQLQNKPINKQAMKRIYSIILCGMMTIPTCLAQTDSLDIPEPTTTMREVTVKATKVKMFMRGDTMIDLKLGSNGSSTSAGRVLRIINGGTIQCNRLAEFVLPNTILLEMDEGEIK